MSKRRKLLEKIKAGPNNAKIEDILKLMRYFGFETKKTSHGYIFKHDKLKTQNMPHVAEPHGKENKVLSIYVEQCFEAIEQLEMEGEEE